jgi:hypothetical protein
VVPDVSNKRVNFILKVKVYHEDPLFETSGIIRRRSITFQKTGVPMSRNLTERNATDRHVRATKLTPIIQLVMTFRPPAVVMTITPWLSLLIWLAGVQVSSLMLFSRHYLIRTPSVDTILLLV